MIKPQFFIHPHFIQKYYLVRDVRDIQKNYIFKGSILDIGCGEKPYKSLFLYASKYIGIDFKSYSKNNTFKETKPDMYFTQKYLTTLKLPFSSEYFDHTVSFQVLEHHKDPKKMINEMTRITKKNGYILLTVPFLWGLHEEPFDYFRYTHFGIEELFKHTNTKILFIKKQGSLPSTIAILMVDSLIEFANKNRLTYILSLILYPFLLAWSYLCLMLDQIFPTKKVFLNYLILAQKQS